MDCLDFQGKITAFISDELTFKEKEAFLEHMRTCENCKDELEIYYIVMNSLRQIDSDTDGISDFNAAFENAIREAEKEINFQKFDRARRRITFPAVMGIAMLLMGVSVSPEEPEKEATDEVVMGDSTFEMKFRFADDPAHRTYESELEELLKHE